MYVVGFMDQMNEVISGRLLYWEEDEYMVVKC